jgi:hypothetical protein
VDRLHLAAAPRTFSRTSASSSTEQALRIRSSKVERASSKRPSKKA